MKYGRNFKLGPAKPLPRPKKKDEDFARNRKAVDDLKIDLELKRATREVWD